MYLTEETLVNSLYSFINENYNSEMLSEGNIVWIYENEYLPSLFEAFVEENYYLDQLSESNLEWIFENEFLPIVENAFNEEWKTTVRRETGEAQQMPPLPVQKPKPKKNKDEIGGLIDRDSTLRGLEGEKPKNESYSPYVSLAASLIEAQEKKSGTLRSKKNMDKVGEEDEDVNNDGKVDSKDGYLHNRRKAIAKAMAAKGKKK